MALFEVNQASGRTLWCSCYVVASTYGDFQIRTPSDKSNSVMLDFARREAAQICGKHVPVHVIEPNRDGEAIDYPTVRISAAFQSMPIRREMDLSMLTVVWFQCEAWPIPDAAALAAFAALDWESLALDGEM